MDSTKEFSLHLYLLFIYFYPISFQHKICAFRVQFLKLSVWSSAMPNYVVFLSPTNKKGWHLKMVRQEPLTSSIAPLSIGRTSMDELEGFTQK